MQVGVYKQLEWIKMVLVFKLMESGYQKQNELNRKHFTFIKKNFKTNILVLHIYHRQTKWWDASLLWIVWHDVINIWIVWYDVINKL